MHRRFILLRTEDISSVSGIGEVAEGCAFENGKVCIAWKVFGKPNSIAVYDSIEDAIGVHGHEGRTTIFWKDVD